MEKDNTYPDSANSSPHSRDIDSENHSWEDQPAPNYRVKFMCSYNGKIQPRPHDNQLTYVGGDTKILAVDRAVKFADTMNKLSIIANSDVVFKYQLPGEDLDALISVTNDEDLEHMMAEYDRVYRLSPKPPRLRLFLFPNKNLISKSSDSNESESKMRIQPNQQWLADSVNSVPTQLTDKTQHTQAQEFLFPEKVLINVLGETSVDDTAISHVEIQRQIHQLQRMQIANQEQAMFRKNSDEALARAFHSGDYYQEKTVPAVNVPGYWQDINGGYTTGAGAGNEHQHPLYLIPPQGAMYQQQPTTTMIPVNNQSPTTAMYPVTSQQGYYPMQRGPPEVYREQPVFSVGPPQPKIIARPGGGGGVGETGYTQQVAYDSAGRQVFYTAAPAPAPGSVMPGPYHTVVGTGGVDLRHVGQVNVNQEGNVATTAAI